jgi:hypothetical protein
MLLPPNSGRISFPAHCVEQGRWTGRGKESAAQFQASTKFAVGNDLKLANATYQQGEVWKNVAIQQDKLSENVGRRINAEESASSLQLALENPAVIAMVSTYENALRNERAKRKNVVGVVIAINGKMTGAEVYGSSALFEKAWPKLLNSAATEALAEKKTRAHAAAPTAREIERFLACGGEPQSPQVGSRADIPLISDGALNDVTVINGEERDRTVERNSLDMNPPARSLIIREGGQPNSESDAREVFRRVNNRGGRVELYSPQGADAKPLPTGGVPGLALPSEGQAMQTEARPSTPGNRLNINRIDNPAGLVTESRDAGRGTAVIHKSYIKR